MTEQSNAGNASTSDARHETNIKEPESQANSRLGLTLFVVYTACYAGFVFVCAFAPTWVEWEPIDGLNLAVLWGFALIILAFILAVVYGIGSSGDGRQDSDEVAS